MESLQKENESQFILEPSPVDGFEPDHRISAMPALRFRGPSPIDIISATISLGLILGFTISLAKLRGDLVPTLIP